MQRFSHFRNLSIESDLIRNRNSIILDAESGQEASMFRGMVRSISQTGLADIFGRVLIESLGFENMVLFQTDWSPIICAESVAA
jgi:hypothetical protein